LSPKHKQNDAHSLALAAPVQISSQRCATVIEREGIKSQDPEKWDVYMLEMRNAHKMLLGILNRRKQTKKILYYEVFEVKSLFFFNIRF
jgi:hypothetical protein